MIAYKVVRSENKKLVSVLIAWGVRYIIGKKTVLRKNCGPLCVFETEDFAKNFCRHLIEDGSERVYKCKIKKSRKKHVWYTVDCGSSFFRSRSTIEKLPEGTILADEVTLLERVK